MVHFQSLCWIYYNIASILCFDFLTARHVGLLPSPSSLCMPHNRPINQRRGAEARNTTLLGKLADGEDSRLTSRRNHLVRVWMPVSFIQHRAGRWGNKVKRLLIWQISPGMASLRRRCVTFSLPVSHPQVDRSWTKAEGRGFLGQAIMYGKYPCSKQINRKQRLK